MLTTPHQTLASADRLAGILLALETCPAAQFTLTPMAARRAVEGPRVPAVFCRIGLERHDLTCADARLVSRCLTLERPFTGFQSVALAFHDAAREAERRAADVAALAADAPVVFLPGVA